MTTDTQLNLPLLDDLEPDFIGYEDGMPLIHYRHLKRYTQAGNRFYYDIRDNKLIPYMSYSTFSSLILPKGQGYYWWVANKGAMAEQEREEKKVFGGIFHRACSQIVVGGDPIHGNGYNFDWLSERYVSPDGSYRKITDENGDRYLTNFDTMIPKDWRHKSYKWLDFFKRGLMSWIVFLQERVVRVWAMELPLKSDKLQVAMTLDFVAEIKFGNGKNNNRLSYLDIKSALYADEDKKKTYFDSHQLQMELGRYIWNENYDDKITHMFNWSPINFKKEIPTFTFENQTDNKFAIPAILGGQTFHQLELMSAGLQARGEMKPPRGTLDIIGSFSDWKTMDYSKHIVKIDV